MHIEMQMAREEALVECGASDTPGSIIVRMAPSRLPLTQLLRFVFQYHHERNHENSTSHSSLAAASCRAYFSCIRTGSQACLARVAPAAITGGRADAAGSASHP